MRTKGRKTRSAIAILNRIWGDIFNDTVVNETSEIRFNQTRYEADETTKVKVAIQKENMVMVSPARLNELDAGELKLTLKIMLEIQQNNALWYFEPSLQKQREKRVISNLAKRELLLLTELPGLYIINPTFIRKGEPRTVIAATVKLVDEARRLSPDMVKRLRKPQRVDRNLLSMLLDES